jgi:hypothetical protein
MAAPASFALAKAVILSIDSATVSGVALSVPEGNGNRITEYETERLGEVKTSRARQDWVKDAAEAAQELDVPLVIVGEEWTPHGISTATYASLCESWGRWLESIELVLGRLDTPPVVHIVRVNPNTWRAAVLGKGRAKKSAELKKQAVQYAALALDQPMLSDNVAEALCIRVWASRAAEVHELLKKRKKAA